jgi:hypothetical protein
MSLTFVSGNALSLGGSVYLNNTSFAPASTMGVTLTFAGVSVIDTVGGAITFPLTVTGTTAGAQSLTLTTTGAISFGGNVGATRLGDINITAGASGLSLGSAMTSIQANSFIVNGTIPALLQNTSLLTIDTSASGSIGFGGIVTGATPFSNHLTLVANGSGSVTFSGNVGDSPSQLGDVTIGAGTGLFVFDTAVTALSARSLTVGGVSAVPTQLKNTALLTLNTSVVPGDIAFHGPITGTTNNSQSLAFNTGTANISVTGAVGAVRLDTITLAATQNATFGSSITAGSLVQTAGTGLTSFAGPINLNAGALTLNGSAFTFSGAVTNTVAGASIQNSGLLTIQTSAPFALHGSFVQTGGGTSSVGADIFSNNNPISFLNPLSISASCSFDTDPDTITFFSTVDGPGALTLIGSTVTFFSTVGNATPLAGLDVTGTSILVYGNHTTTGAMSYTGPVTLNANMTFLNTGAGGMSFSSTITGNRTLVLSAPSTFISVGGAISTAGSAGMNGREITLSAGSDITLAGSLSSEGGTLVGASGPSGGDIAIISSGGTISVGDINTSGTDAVLIGGSAGDLIIQPASGTTNGPLGNIPNGRIVLNGDITAQGGTGAISGQSGDIQLSVIGRSDYPSIATIVSSYSGNSVTIEARTLTMGTNEVMTVAGSILFNLTESATVSDMVARDSLTIVAPSGLTLVGHGLEQVLDFTGTLYYIYGGHILARTFISAPVTTVIGPFGVVGLVDIANQALFQGAISYVPNSYLLNYAASQPAPPVVPVNPTTPISRESFIAQLGVASISFEDLLPMIPRWGVWSYPYRGAICPIDPDQPCWPIPHLFDAFLLENQVVNNP